MPSRKETDQWLYLAQHVRLPTRPLDWTEGLLFALHFALDGADQRCIVEECDECQRLESGRPKRNPNSLVELLDQSKKIGTPSSRILREFTIDQRAVKGMRKDLRMLGISPATLFPDLDHLAQVLKDECRNAR